MMITVMGLDCGSCVGHCGSSDGTFCYCDESCTAYGDCCADACTVCSMCAYDDDSRGNTESVSDESSSLTESSTNCLLLAQYDSAGDGWNSFYFSLYSIEDTRNALQSLTLESGSFDATCLQVEEGACYVFGPAQTEDTFDNVQSEISWELCEQDGDAKSTLTFCFDSCGCVVIGTSPASIVNGTLQYFNSAGQDDSETTVDNYLNSSGTKVGCIFSLWWTPLMTMVYCTLTARLWL